MVDRRMLMSAPWPADLDDLVGRARCHDGWSFHLADGEWDDGFVTGLRLIITVRSVDAYHPDRPRGTSFLFPVPVATFDRGSWQRWLWDRVMDVHHHETGEAFGFAYHRPGWDGAMEVMERPFAPFHGPGRDPNRNIEVGVDPMEARVTQSGGIYPGYWWDGHVVHTDRDHEDCRGQSYGPPRCVPVQVVKAVGNG